MTMTPETDSTCNRLSIRSDRQSRQTRTIQRNRRITACLECRRRRQKCDRIYPCSTCFTNGRTCTYMIDSSAESSQNILKKYKERVANTESILKHDVTVPVSTFVSRKGEALPEPIQSCPWLAIIGDEDVADDDDIKHIRPSFVLTAAIEDTNRDVYVGRMALSGRLGGFFTSEMANEIDNLLLGLNEVNGMHDIPQSSYKITAFHSRCVSFSGILKRSTADICPFLMPDRAHCDRLFNHYCKVVDAVTPLVYLPDHKQNYERFWQQIYRAETPPLYLQALVASSLFAAAASMEQCATGNSAENDIIEMIKIFENIAISTLLKADCLSTTDLCILQALMIYLMPKFQDTRTVAHTSTLASAISIAECMQIHREGDLGRYTPAELQVRRLIWYQLCVLDIRLCDAGGPRPQIRMENFDVNITREQDTIEGTMCLCSDANPYSNAFSTMLFECNEMQRMIWVDLPSLEKGKIHLAKVLRKVENFARTMQKKYEAVFHGTSWMEYCKVVLRIHISKMYLMATSPYHRILSQHKAIPLADMIIKNTIQLIEDAVTIDTNPDYRIYSWNSTSYQQYQNAYLLLVTILTQPDHPESDRIWTCLDHVFAFDLPLTPPQKAIAILKELRSKIQGKSEDCDFTMLNSYTTSFDSVPRVDDWFQEWEAFVEHWEEGHVLEDNLIP